MMHATIIPTIRPTFDDDDDDAAAVGEPVGSWAIASFTCTSVASSTEVVAGAPRTVITDEFASMASVELIAAFSVLVVYALPWGGSSAKRASRLNAAVSSRRRAVDDLQFNAIMRILAIATSSSAAICCRISARTEAI